MSLLRNFFSYVSSGLPHTIITFTCDLLEVSPNCVYLVVPGISVALISCLRYQLLSLSFFRSLPPVTLLTCMSNTGEEGNLVICFFCVNDDLVTTFSCFFSFYPRFRNYVETFDFMYNISIESMYYLHY